MLEKLFKYSEGRLLQTAGYFQRDELNEYPFEQRLLGLQGSRGVGKTTVFLQHMAQTYKDRSAIYLSLDDIYFTEHKLVDVAEEFVRMGGHHMYIDEVHKYPNWSLEVKNIYDTYPQLKVAFTGSSISHLQAGNADLSRRAIIRRMQGLSFRQFINLLRSKEGKAPIPKFSLEEILNNGIEVIRTIMADGIKPYLYFERYLQEGYYPFFTEGEALYHERLAKTIQAVLEIDFGQLYNVNVTSLRSIYTLLYAISTSPPFQPNIERLSTRIGIARKTLLEYIHYLYRADVLNLLKDEKFGMSILKKPNKIYLENTNLLYNFAPFRCDKGTVRETFVINQLRNDHAVRYTKKGDVLVDDKYIFEIGGKNKTKKQIATLQNAYILADDTEFVYENKIPMYLLGMMY